MEHYPSTYSSRRHRPVCTSPPPSPILSCTTRHYSPSCSPRPSYVHLQPKHTTKLGTILTSNILGFTVSAFVSLPSDHRHYQLDIRVSICQSSRSLSPSCNSCQIYFLRCFLLCTPPLSILHVDPLYLSSALRRALIPPLRTIYPPFHPFPGT